MSTDDPFKKLDVGSRPFEERIQLMHEIEGGKAPTTAIWIVGHLDDFGKDYPNQMKRLYNSFIQTKLDRDGIEYKSMLRYIRLLVDSEPSILVEEDGSDHTIQEQGFQNKFPKNFYSVSEDFQTEWARETPEDGILIEELRKPVPGVLLELWSNQ